MGECGSTDSSKSLSVRDQSFCDFGAGESKAPSSQRALNAQETRCTGGFIKAVGTMMRMLLIWLLAFSTFVGVGCEEHDSAFLHNHALAVSERNDSTPFCMDEARPARTCVRVIKFYEEQTCLCESSLKLHGLQMMQRRFLQESMPGMSEASFQG